MIYSRLCSGDVVSGTKLGIDIQVQTSAIVNWSIFTDSIFAILI